MYQSAAPKSIPSDKIVELYRAAIEDFLLKSSVQRLRATLQIISQMFFWAARSAFKGFAPATKLSSLSKSCYPSVVKHSAEWAAKHTCQSRSSIDRIRKLLEKMGMLVIRVYRPQHIGGGSFNSPVTELFDVDWMALAELAKAILRRINELLGDEENELPDHKHGFLAAVVRVWTGKSLFRSEEWEPTGEALINLLTPWKPVKTEFPGSSAPPQTQEQVSVLDALDLSWAADPDSDLDSIGDIESAWELENLL